MSDHVSAGQILHDQLRILFSNIISNSIGSVLIIAIYLWIFKENFTTNWQYAWAAFLSSLLVLRLVMYRRSLISGMAENPDRWLLFYCFLLFFIGVCWGSLLLVPMEGLDSETVGFTVVTLLLALGCVSSISSSAHPAAVWSFLIPICFFTSYYLVKSPAEEFGFIIGIGAIAFCIAVGFVGHTIHKMIVSALYLQTRNASLMDEVVQIAKQNQKSYEGFQLLLDNLGAGAAMFDSRHKVISWNKSFENIFDIPAGLIKRGMSLTEIVRKVIKQSWQNNIDVDHAASVHIKEILSNNDDKEMVNLVLADGRNLYSKVMRINDDRLILNYTDVTSLEQARTDDIIHVLQHDSLTGLPNHVLHKKEVEKRITQFQAAIETQDASLDNQFMCLVHFGLNSLNEIYEFSGLGAGDQVVTEIANRCKDFLGEGAYLAHVTYDEFNIVTEKEKNTSEVIELVDNLLLELSRPIEIGGKPIMMEASVGISVYPDHADKAGLLYRNAKIAFNKAKLTSEENIVVYNQGMHSEIMQRTNMLFDIRDSMKNSQFSLHYQPQVDIKSNQVIGVEALLRWQHPEKGWITPEDFIPLAENTKQIIPLTEQFLPEACYQAKRWQEQGLSPVNMSVNISPFHFHEKGFTSFIRSCFEGANLEPQCLELEITEGIIMNQTEEIINILHELSEMGIKLSIDDFGTGYSSLAYLRRLPVDKLKIDQAFIKDMEIDDSALSLVEAVIRLGHSFNLNVIAEGVETKEQLTRLLTLNCDQAQGFFIKRPENAEDITRWIKDNNA